MFRAENWALAFTNAAKTSLAAEEALQYLKVFCSIALSLPGDLSGKNDADRFGKCIHTAGIKYFTNNAKEHSSENFILAERFIQLILQKGCFNHYKKIIRSIETKIDREKGIEEVIVEVPVEIDREFIKNLEEKAKIITGANEIKLTQRLMPELIGGLRLRWRSMLYDGSIRRALEMMTLKLKSQNI